MVEAPETEGMATTVDTWLVEQFQAYRAREYIRVEMLGGCLPVCGIQGFNIHVESGARPDDEMPNSRMVEPSKF
eukprot:1523046-Ditylum_brightwellii.AAC.1